MRTSVIVLATLIGLAACSDDNADPTSDPTPTTADAAESAPVTIEAVEACGPMDASSVQVQVEGIRGTTLMAEMVLNGEVVATSDPVNTSRDSLLIENPVDPVLTEQNDIITILDITGALIRVRPIDGGPVVAVDRSIAPYPADLGGCG